jgi:diadenosine tetraphosphate (Ap4A) HIT family hydrolase
MPETPEELFTRAAAAAGPDGRLPVAPAAAWDIFPFELDGLTVKRLEPPVLPEPPREGEGGRACSGCDRRDEGIWRNERWRLAAPGEPDGLPATLLLLPREHHDLGDLPDDLAAELGMLTVRLDRAMRSLDGVARVHVNKWGDGGSHLHVWFLARPAGFGQLRGTCLALWNDILPPIPEAVWRDNLRLVGTALAAEHGGEILI